MYATSSIVFGFHGCDQSVADYVISEKHPLNSSEQRYDWIGHGIYFWEGSQSRALDWAHSRPEIAKPAVIGAVINLGNCLDLLDERCIQQVSTAHKVLIEELKEIGKPPPENTATDPNGFSLRRELDCAVIMRLHQLNNETITEELGLKNAQGKNKRVIQNHPDFLDSVRGMFPEGDQLYNGAGFRASNHIQLCIVNPNCILGYFSPQNPNTWYKRF
ncbi:MAG: hypothetical protein KKF24_12925 [Gammaproteobacteria bacterium]|nr:hypothetical protein [Gammaproteobacteria bacterium]